MLVVHLLEMIHVQYDQRVFSVGSFGKDGVRLRNERAAVQRGALPPGISEAEIGAEIGACPQLISGKLGPVPN